MLSIKRLAIAACCLAIVAGCLIWQRLTINRTTTELTHTVEQLKAANNTADVLRLQLHTAVNEAAANDQAQASLRNDLSATADLLAARTRTIERLKHENQKLRDWADTPLPDDIVRLRDRPALTGATAYRDWLSSSNSLPTASDSAAEQRPDAQ